MTQLSSSRSVHLPSTPEDEARGPDKSDSFLRRWVLSRRALTAGLVVSLIIHVILLTVASVWVLSRGGSSGEAEGAGEVDVAVMTDAELQQLISESLDATPPPVAELEMPELSAAIDAMPAESRFDSLDVQADLGVDLGAGDLGSDAGMGTGGAGGGAAKFFGVEATGTRFAFVVDVSGSMAFHQKIDHLKSELIEAVTGLLENAEFFVVTFSSSAQPLGGRPNWQEATAGGKRWARKMITAIRPGGGTEPYPAFEYVFRLRPKPDAIYFMTDGEFNPQVASQIIALNRDRKIPIHAITFVNRSAEELMRRIAHRSGGTYSHVEGAR